MFGDKQEEKTKTDTDMKDLAEQLEAKLTLDDEEKVEAVQEQPKQPVLRNPLLARVAGQGFKSTKDMDPKELAEIKARKYALQAKIRATYEEQGGIDTSGNIEGQVDRIRSNAKNDWRTRYAESKLHKGSNLPPIG